MAFTVLLGLIIVGIAWYFLKPYVAEPFGTMVVVLLVLFFVLWLLSTFGLLQVPRLFGFVVQ